MIKKTQLTINRRKLPQLGKMARMFVFKSFSQYYTGNPSQWNKARKRN